MKLLSGLGILLIFGGLAAAALTWPGVLTHHEAVRNLGLVVAGMIAIPLAVWRAVVAQRQAETARRSLLNERDQKAAEMLGSALLSVRLGGIYALQTLAAEHPPHYHLGVMRQFCAFVRSPPSPPNSTAAGLAHVPGEDVRAVMDAISTRSDAGIAIEQEEEGFRLDLVGVNLSGVNLRKAKLSGVNLRKAKLSRAKLSGADLSWAELAGANLSGANLSGADLSWAYLWEADLSGAELAGAKLSRAKLSGAELAGASLSGADLSWAVLWEANLSGADLSWAVLWEAKLAWAELAGANLSGAKLSGAVLSEADLSEADLSGADLSGAKLSGAVLSEADLSGANLSGANLSGADLSGANLSGANLSGANLSGADLSGANLNACNIASARFSPRTVITQEQLDQTLAKPPEKPPIFEDKVCDAKTGDPLEWRGPTA